MKLTEKIRPVWFLVIIMLFVLAASIALPKIAQHRAEKEIYTQILPQAADIAERYGLEFVDVSIRKWEDDTIVIYFADYYISNFGKLSIRQMYGIADELDNIEYSLKTKDGRVCLGDIYSGDNCYEISNYVRHIYKNGETIDSDYKNSPCYEEYAGGKDTDSKAVSTPAPSPYAGKIYDNSPDVSDFSNPEDFYDYYYDDFSDYYDAESYYYDHGGE